MEKHFIVFLLIIANLIAEAQKSLDISVKNSTYLATDSLLPFWFTANQSGKIKNSGSLLNLSDIYVRQHYKDISTVDYTVGVNVVAAIGKSSYFQLNQAFAGILWKGWELKAGIFQDPILYEGLSTTNGNLARSQNARPYPKIRFATLNYKPVPFMQNRLRYKAEYGEGFLNDARYVDNTRLHHKSFYLQAHLADTWKMHAGLEHFVMWGGTSPEFGKMPSGFRDYFRYIFGTSGGEEFPVTDQRNVAGNQLGTWQFLVQKEFSILDVSLYFSHLFEELSGLKWRNWPDNLIGFHVNFRNKDQFITDVVYEYTNTRQQSIYGTDDDPDPGNYFRHGIYRSSFTYHQQMMGSPLFFPVVINDGIVRGLESNRFYAHHAGVKGSFGKNFKWEGLITYIHHLGLYNAPYNPSQKQLSGILNLLYMDSRFPADLGLSLAADTGNTIHQRAGVQFRMIRMF